MRTMSDMLAYEAKRRPEIKSIIDNLASYTIEEISQLKMPLPWFTKALLELKKKCDSKKSFDQDSSAVLKHIKSGYTTDFLGKTYQWTGMQKVMKVDRGGGIELKENRLLFFPDSGGMWYETLFTQYIDPSLESQCRFLRKETKNQYTEAYRSIINGIILPFDTQIIGEKQSPLSQYGVRFS